MNKSVTNHNTANCGNMLLAVGLCSINSSRMSEINKITKEAIKACEECKIAISIFDEKVKKNMSELKTFQDLIKDAKPSKVHEKIRKLKKYKWFYKIKNLILVKFIKLKKYIINQSNK